MSDQTHTILLLAGFLAMGVAFISGRALTHKLELGRRLYWGGWAVGIPLFAVGMAAPLPNIVAAVAILAVLAVALAYILTPYLTINGRTYAMQERFRSGE